MPEYRYCDRHWQDPNTNLDFLEVNRPPGTVLLGYNIVEVSGPVHARLPACPSARPPAPACLPARPPAGKPTRPPACTVLQRELIGSSTCCFAPDVTVRVSDWP
jgi:hypothetical protein